VSLIVGHGKGHVACKNTDQAVPKGLCNNNNICLFD